MKTRAAVLTEVPGKWEIHNVELDPPREHEVLVRMVACGLCHSDDHFATGTSASGICRSAAGTRPPGSWKRSDLASGA
jgi:S-(hydroxymethyl)glutathione dehydrogenase/alcohol dehydrogenase